MLLLAFIDSFSLYRNIRRSLIGFYLINGALKASKRNRRTNIILLTLGPYESNFTDVVKGLPAIKDLNASIILSINRVKIIVYTFPLVYLSNIP